MKSLKVKTILIMLLVITFGITNISEAQQVNRISDKIGGSSGNTGNVNDSKDNTFLYVAGVAIIAGIVVYAILSDKKPVEKTKSDTTAILNNEELINKYLTFNDKFQSYQTQIPINLSIGIQNDLVRIEEKRYFVGLRYNF